MHDTLFPRRMKTLYICSLYVISVFSKTLQNLTLSSKHMHLTFWNISNVDRNTSHLERTFLFVKREMCDVDDAGWFEYRLWNPENWSVEWYNCERISVFLKSVICTENTNKRHVVRRQSAKKGPKVEVEYVQTFIAVYCSLGCVP